jgi:hypothetical protein
MRAGKREQVLQECIRLFEKMADRTGTLWEHNGIYASCNHGFASYAIKWIIYALSGYDCINCDYTSNTGIGIDCEIKIPSVAQGEEIATITVKNNLVTIT